MDQLLATAAGAQLLARYTAEHLSTLLRALPRLLCVSLYASLPVSGCVILCLAFPPYATDRRCDLYEVWVL